MKRSIPRVQGAAKSLAKGELIGRVARVHAANDAGLVGVAGEIVDETLHTVTLRMGGPGARRMQISKVGTTFAFPGPDAEILVDGAAIEFRPEDRTKKVK